MGHRPWWRSRCSWELVDRWPLGLCLGLHLYGSWCRLTCDLLDGLETKLHLWGDGPSGTGSSRHGEWAGAGLDRPGAGLDRSRPGAGTGLDWGRPGAGLGRCGTRTCWDRSTLNSSGLFGCSCRSGSGSERLCRPIEIVENSKWNGSGLLWRGWTGCGKAGARAGSQCGSWGGRSWLLNKLRLRESWRGTGLGLLTNRDSVESWRKTWTGLGLSNSESWRRTGSLGLTGNWESSCRESSWWLTSNGSSISGKPWWLLTRGRASGGDRARRPNSWEWLEEKAARRIGWS